jgi:hypothetical protein
LLPWLERLAHPRIRLLEKFASNRFRLPHERLIPILRRLTNNVLASLDQLKLAFEVGFTRWLETHSNQNLLKGRELREVMRKSDFFLGADDAARKAEYIRSCLRRRNMFRWAVSTVLVAAVAIGYTAIGFWDRSIQRQKLASWSLPIDLLNEQNDINSLTVQGGAINDLTWLSSARLKELHLNFFGSSLAGLGKLPALTSLNHDLDSSTVTSLAGLEKLTALTSLNLSLGGSMVTSLAGLEEAPRAHVAQP